MSDAFETGTTQYDLTDCERGSDEDIACIIRSYKAAIEAATDHASHTEVDFLVSDLTQAALTTSDQAGTPGETEVPPGLRHINWWMNGAIVAFRQCG